MSKKNLRDTVFHYLSRFDISGKNAVYTKFTNICGKTGRYDVPEELFQKRTHRKNRILFPWKDVQGNSLTLEQLNTISNGVVIEFVNDDYFSVSNSALFTELKNRLGSDENVSSIISIRAANGTSSSNPQRLAFQKLKDVFPNYKNYILRRRTDASKGNNSWEGFIYYSIRGGQQDTERSHTDSRNYPLLFNPAVEYANEDVCLDIDLVLAYFALYSIPEHKRNSEYQQIMYDMEAMLSSPECTYDDGNLLNYCNNHYCLKFHPGKLTDPIQMVEISIDDFSITDRKNDDILDLTHNEAANKGIYYFDSHKNSILSPARPKNLFWSKKLSNMMQQNFTLDGFFAHEENIVNRRKQILNH